MITRCEMTASENNNWLQQAHKQEHISKEVQKPARISCELNVKLCNLRKHGKKLFALTDFVRGREKREV